MLNSAGTPVGYHDYLPFGEEILGGAGSLGGRGSLYGAADGVTHKFTDKERDAELAGSAMQGFDYFGARYFSAAQGRFTSPDWSATSQPIPYADLTDPQTLNLYGYVRNNPLRLIDPNGHGEGEGLLRQWLNVLEVKASVAVGVGASGQFGRVEYKAKATLVGVEAKSGLGGEGAEVKGTFLKAEASGSAGPAEAKVSAGVELSSVSGPSVGAKGEVAFGGAGVKAGVDVAPNGVSPTAGAAMSSDFLVGPSGTLGIGLGVDINFSQLGRAFDSTVQAFTRRCKMSVRSCTLQPDRSSILEGYRQPSPESKIEVDMDKHSNNRNRPRRLRWVLLIIFVVAAIVLVYAGPYLPALTREAGPVSSALSEYSDALVRRDYKRAYELTSKEFRQAVSAEAFVGLQEQLAGRYGRLLAMKQGATAVTIRRSEPDWRGVLNVRAHYEHGDLQFIFVLHHEDRWVLYGCKDAS